MELMVRINYNSFQAFFTETDIVFEKSLKQSHFTVAIWRLFQLKVH